MIHKERCPHSPKQKNSNDAVAPSHELGPPKTPDDSRPFMLWSVGADGLPVYGPAPPSGGTRSRGPFFEIPSSTPRSPGPAAAAALRSAPRSPGPAAAAALRSVYYNTLLAPSVLPSGFSSEEFSFSPSASPASPPNANNADADGESSTAVVDGGLTGSGGAAPDHEHDGAVHSPPTGVEATSPPSPRYVTARVVLGNRSIKYVRVIANARELGEIPEVPFLDGGPTETEPERVIQIYTPDRFAEFGERTLAQSPLGGLARAAHTTPRTRLSLYATHYL